MVALFKLRNSRLSGLPFVVIGATQISILESRRRMISELHQGQCSKRLELARPKFFELLAHWVLGIELEPWNIRFLEPKINFI